MKKSLIKAAAVAAVSFVSTSGAFAQTASQTITLNAFISSYCSIGASGLPGASGSETAGNLAVTNTRDVAAQLVTLSNAGKYPVACSSPNTITVKSANDGLRNFGAATNNNINYVAVVKQQGGTIFGGPADLTTTLTTGGTGVANQVVTAQSGAAISGEMTVTINTVAATALPNGTFTDTLTVTLTPQ